MYEELVKRLRNRANGSYEEKCEGCEFTEDFPPCAHCTIKAFNDAADAIEEMQQTVEHYRGCSDDWYKEACDYKAMLPHWIPVTERLPKKYQYAVCWVNDEENKRGFYGIGSLSRSGDWYVDGDDYSENENLHVTHWMPLPEPPKEDE